jgi:phosphatidate cytidylyltransferase
LLPPLILLILYGGIQGFGALVVIAVILGTHEFYRMVETKQLTCYKIPGLILSGVVSCSFLSENSTFISFTLAIATILVVVHALSGPYPLSTAIVSVSTTIFGITYVSWFLSHLVLLRGLDHGIGLIFYLFLIIWVGDTGAFYVGASIGKHKLAPMVSPKKTVEGALGGLAASMLIALIAKKWLVPFLSYKHAWILGGLLAVLGQLGDLGKSVFKRDAGIKDSGNIIPGHGGILDRVDGLLFSTPVLYYYIKGFL